MPFSSPRLNTIFRWLVFLLAVSILVWLPVEDYGPGVVLFFAWGISLLAVYAILRRLFPQSIPWWSFFAAGLLAGAAVTPVALILMAIKTSLHSHGTPDFSAANIQQAVELIPVWLTAGGLLGLGTALYYRTAR